MSIEAEIRYERERAQNPDADMVCNQNFSLHIIHLQAVMLHCILSEITMNLIKLYGPFGGFWYVYTIIIMKSIISLYIA